MLDKTRPMQLGDIFSNSFTLIGKTFLRNLVVAAVFFIPLGLLFAFGLQNFFSNLSSIQAGETNLLTAAGFLLYIFSTFLFYFGYLGVHIGVFKITIDQAEGKHSGIGDALREIFSVTLLKSVGFILLLFLMMGGGMTIAIIFTSIGAVADSFIMTFIGIFLILITIVLFIYFIFRWFFTIPVFIHSGAGIFEAMKKSSSLVEDNWWRVFGIILLISLVVSFAVSLLTTPVMFASMWDFYAQSIKSMSENAEPDPQASFEMLKSMGIGFGITIIFSSIVQTLIIPVFYVVMYFDLKIRKNDFPQEEPPSEEPAVDPWEPPAIE